MTSTNYNRVPTGPVDAIPVMQIGALSYNNSAGTAGHAVKTGPGILHRVSINTGGTTSICTLYDGTSTGGTKLATIATTAIGSIEYDVAFATGLFAVLSTSNPADVTISYF